ncbi:MAG: hypothetical protein RLZZ77_2391 [Bacteroidota bacterium]|jgi:uncharacterized protein YdcH (DUF465 family)
MNEALKFQRLSEIASELQKHIELLESGQLSTPQVEVMTNQARELYERLIVLRFRAYDKDVKSQPAAEEQAATTPVEAVTETPVMVTEEKPQPFIAPIQLEESTPEVEEPIQEIQFEINAPTVEETEEEKAVESTPFSFRVSEPTVAPNQVNLIDAIEEIESTQEIEAPKIEPAQFTSPLFKTESVNDRLSKTVGAQETLAQKMENTPISDLKKAITLNQRFQFSKELFKGNNQDYEVTIDRLNTSSRDEAMRTLDTLRSKYAWNNESIVAQDFTELVERRYL